MRGLIGRAAAAMLAAGGAGVLVLGGAPIVLASVASHGKAVNPYSPAYGHPYRNGVVPTIGRQRQMNGWAHTHAVQATSANNLNYGGGISGVGVTTGAEQVYLVFWGSQWGSQGTDSNGYATFAGDPQGVAPDLQAFFKGLGTGSETWSGVMTQYCQGVAVGAQSCPASAAHVAYPMGGALAHVWEDTSGAAPAQATGHQIAVEAENAAAHFGNTTAALNRNAQYVIVSPTGTNPDNYIGQGFCAWHDYSGDGTLDGGGGATGPLLAFTNLPYVPDAGASCGAGFVNAGNNLDGVTIVDGHEYAETITDQFPAGGWLDTSGAENGDKCAWIVSGQGAAQNIALTTGSFAVQSTWANDFNGGTGGCEVSHSIVTNGNSVTVTNPGTQAGTIGTAVSLQIHASDSDSSQTLTYSAAGLPAGLSINSTSGLISGTPTTAGTSNVTVTVTDTTSASGSASFSWNISSIKTATVTKLGSSPSPSVVGGTVTYTATITPNPGGGTVKFSDNGTAVCSAVALSSGTAQCKVTYKTVGTHSVTALYSGDASYTGSQATLTQQVTYAIHLTYNPATAHAPGTSFYLMLQLRNSAGHDVSASSIVVTVAGLSPSPAPGKAPTGNFAFIAGTSTNPAHYHLQIHSTSYPAHTYTLSFKVTGDPVTHTITFIIS